MGVILDKPMTDKEVTSFNEGAFRGVVASMQGWRNSMEDSFIVSPTVEYDKDTGFFAVFDGHGGNATSRYCAEYLLKHLVACVKELYADSVPTVDQYRQLLRDSFIQFDQQIKETDISRSGSTAITGFITPEYFIISNLGDSRCVLSSDGKAIALSEDHKPTLSSEKARITRAGGIVYNGRVNGDLAVARAFGDFMYKRRLDLPPESQEVSCEPDVRVTKRSIRDNFIFFACDGVWDVFPDPEELVQELTRLLRSYETPEKALVTLLDTCLERGSMDNMTALLVLLNDPPRPDEELIRQQRTIDEEKERLSKELKSKSEKSQK